MNPRYKAALEGFDVVPWLRLNDIEFTPMEGTDEIVLECPLCEASGEGEGAEKLWYNTAKRIGFCYKCEHSFRPDKILIHLGGMNSLSAMAYVLDQAKGVEDKAIKDFHARLLEEDAPEEDSPDMVPEIELPPEFVRYRRGMWHPSYFEARGITEAQAVYHKLGWCTRGRFRDRLVIPVYTLGKLVAFNTRIMMSAAEIKSANLRIKKECGTDHKLFKKKKIKPYKHQGKTKYAFFNYDRARTRKSIVLCEGVFDAIRVGPDAMALLGKSVGEYKYKLLTQTDAEEFVLMFDPDEAGISATIKIGERLSNIVPVRVAMLPDDRDPDEFPRSYLNQVREEALPFSVWRDRAAMHME